MVNLVYVKHGPIYSSAQWIEISPSANVVSSVQDRHAAVGCLYIRIIELHIGYCILL